MDDVDGIGKLALKTASGFALPSPHGGSGPRRVLDQVKALGIERNIVELELLGYTVLTPDQTRAGDLVERLKAAVLREAERRTGVTPKLDADSGYEAMDAALGKGLFMRGIALCDPVFAESLVNPAALAVTDYLVGEDAILNQMTAMVKGRGGTPLDLHCDTYGMPGPLSAHAHFANLTWLLTDYTIENGCTHLVEGSHRLCRQPTPYENADRSILTPVIAPAGSLLVWHGNTWHGAAPRTAPGLRLFISNFFSRWYIEPQDRYDADLTLEASAAHPRLARLLGLARLMRSERRQLDIPMHSPFAADQFSSAG
jgi:ectoine hydroxylase-related dioxygenase (phytanoyl-CoA dioxygenase family)